MNDPRFDFSQRNDRNFKNCSSRLSQIDDDCSSNKLTDQEFVQFRTNFGAPSAAESDDSGVCSPPLWKSSPSPSSEPLLSRHVYRSLSPASRVQAIVRGQKELMEMVRNMPESSYELSLKDLVEHQRIEAEPPPPPPPQTPPQKGAARVKRQESKKNGSFEMEGRGLFLKMVFPFSLPSKRRSNVDRSFSGRVSLKGGGGGGGEGEWWGKKLRGSSGSDSSRISNSGGGSSRSSSAGSSSGRSYGGSGGRRKEVIPAGCWPFFRSKAGKQIRE